MKDTRYIISVIVRDENNKIVEDKKGIRYPQFHFDLLLDNKKQLEYQMKAYQKTFKAMMPNFKINIEAGVQNEIGGTIMCVASLYDDKEESIFH